MSKDIRSYFGNASGSSALKSCGPHQQSKKRNRRIFDSDDDDDDFVETKSEKKKHKQLENSGSKKDKKPEVVIDVENYFGNTPIVQKKRKFVSPNESNHSQTKKSPEKQKKVKANKKKKKGDEKDEEQPVFECDDELEASILQTDDEILVTAVHSSENKNSSLGKQEELINSIENSNKKQNVETLVTPSKHDSKPIKTPGKGEKGSAEKAVPNSDQKRRNVEAYQKYLHRSGPKNPGSKEIPQGSPVCLQGLAFVITGILDSLERDEAVDLIQKHGGRVTGQISKKTNFIVVGEEPGVSKIEKAEKFGTKKISEDELLNMIVQKSETASNKDNFIQGTPEKTSKYSDKVTLPKRSKTIDSIKMEESVSQPKIQKKEKEPEGQLHLSKAVSPLKTYSASTCQNNTKVSDDIPATKIEKTEDMLWVEKYKPKSTKGIVGQGGDRSNVKKLTYWLQNWHKNHSGKDGKKASRPAPWAQNDDGGYFKAALLSGAPGVGKTTTIHLVCQELGLDIIEFNASDTRSKRLLQEDVAELLSSKSLRGFLHESKKSYSNQVLVMDEVDGMAGNEDRGGIQELIQLIKNTKIPIVGICNDRNHPKMRSLVNHCFDLRFQRPPVKQIKAAMMSICFKENINISGEALEELIVSSNHDLRQVLHRLSLLTFGDKTLSIEQARKDGVDGKKPLNLGPWDVIRKVFSVSDQEKASLSDRMDLFFQDYSLGPLFVQDCYLHVKPHGARNSEIQTLSRISRTAESIALGDIVERTIRNKNSWNLLPVQAVFSSVLPGHHMAGHFTGRIEFPAWLGKTSKAKKFSRLIQELHTSLSTCISGDDSSVNLDYLPHLKDSITRPLVEKGSGGVEEAVKFMVDYGLVREDLDHILELSSWPGLNDAFSSVDSKVKAAFTRALNKECQKVSCATKKIGKISVDEAETDLIDEDTPVEENDNIDFDPMIKKGKPKKATKNESANKGAKKEPTKKGKSKDKK